MRIILALILVVIILGVAFTFFLNPTEEQLTQGKNEEKIKIQSSQDANKVIEDIENDMEKTVEIFEGMKQLFETT